MASAHPDLVADAPLARFTTIRVGGNADWLAEPGSARAVTAALAWARDADVPVAIVGKGSNLLIDDAGFRGLVLRLRGRLEGISVRDGRLWCGGGASLPRAVLRAASAGLTGLEFGASIPGTVGGAVAMNAGAYSGELKRRPRVGGALLRRRAPPRGAGRSALRLPVERGARRSRSSPRCRSASGPGDPDAIAGDPGRLPPAPSRDPASGRAHLRQRLHEPTGRLRRAPAGGRRVQGARGGRGTLLARPRELHRGLARVLERPT